MNINEVEIGTYLSVPSLDFFYKGSSPDSVVPPNEIVKPELNTF